MTEESMGASLRDRATHEQSPQAVSPVPASIPCAWFHMFDAPRDGRAIILCLGDTIPDVPFVVTASFMNGASAEDLGYREYAKYGGWWISHEGCTDWYMVDIEEPRGWLPMPEGVATAKAIEARQGGNAAGGAVHESAVPAGHSPKPSSALKETTDV